ncbi:Hypothetical Protein FCC1311_023072 [Hondaea fermentalgiana]|uniref:GCK domain-containing protein n=1 Tax=Hondaea fermentalgiana TaxID=2315210 RepID=A0A2R5G4Y6_9STRA|nr:Hypothetical Protein FCC1311_023072 [Hondaea fermentalgiana]|eukprot:GBG26087.1 Hypothetical Protein FCC1311_023072 [Hondaea fermentalgiana]
MRAAMAMRAARRVAAGEAGLARRSLTRRTLATATTAESAGSAATAATSVRRPNVAAASAAAFAAIFSAGALGSGFGLFGGRAESAADEPPADEPPADEVAADEPPADEPPADEPPADEEEVAKPPKWDYVPSEGDYTAVFLDEASMEKLRARFPPLFPANPSYDHMTVIFEPTREQVLDHDDLLSENFTLHVIGYAQDEHCQSVLVEIGSPHLESANKYAHITLSYKGGEPYEAKYSNVLFHRLAATDAKKSFYMLKNAEGQNLYWNGKLPEAGSYEPVRASFQNVEDEQMTVTGTYCLKSTFDKEKRTCGYKRENECAFCKFMKGGPCRNEFIAWEKCVNESKDSEDKDAFVDRCAPQTIVLKNCVDSHPEYYFMLDEPSDADAAEAPEPAEAAESVEASEAKA